MALQGTIETFALPDVLRLLATSAKTGMLAVEGDRGTGAVWVANGDIIATDIDLGAHPSTGSTEVSEGIFQLLRFETGEFVFTSDIAPASPSEPQNVEASIADSSTMIDELNQITENVPGMESHVALRREIETNEVTLTADQWRVLSAVGSGTTVARIASTFSYGELDALRRVDDLVHEGVIDISDQPAIEDTISVDSISEDTISETPSEAVPVEPSFADSPEPIDAFASDEPSAFDASTDAEDPFAPSPLEELSSGEEPVDPFAAAVNEADSEEESAVDQDVVDPFAVTALDTPVEDAAIVDPFAATESSFDAPVADPFAPSAIAEESVEESLDAQSDDPFAPAAGAVAGAAAVGATGGVLHDVFGNGDADTATAWEATAEEPDHAPSEWPVPNVAGEVDADAPWSDDAAQSQLPPPPSPVLAEVDAVDDLTSQLPPPPAMAGADSGPVTDPSTEQAPDAFGDLPAPPQSEFDGLDTPNPLPESELPAPPSFEAPAGAPDVEVAGVASFPEAPVVAQSESISSESNDMARQLASLSPAAARAVANAAKAETPAARDEALAEAEAEDASVDRSLLLRFLGKSDKKES